MIVIDTNVILAFLLTNGIVGKIIDKYHDVFITPDHCFKEVWEHRDQWNVHNFSDEKLDMTINDVKRFFILSLPENLYIRKIYEAF